MYGLWFFFNLAETFYKPFKTNDDEKESNAVVHVSRDDAFGEVHPSAEPKLDHTIREV